MAKTNDSTKRPIQESRTHDKDIYLAERRYEQPKEPTKTIVELVTRFSWASAECTVADFGCAAGEFLYWFNRTSPKAYCTGYDVIPELLARGREEVPSVGFLSGSVLDSGLIQDASLDIAFMFGVHSMFDEFEPCLGNLLQREPPRRSYLRLRGAQRVSGGYVGKIPQGG